MFPTLITLKSKLHGGPGWRALLNECLRLSLNPTGSAHQLREQYPYLSTSDIESIGQAVRSAEQFASQVLSELMATHGTAAPSREFAARVAACHPWVTPANVSTLFSQGMYCALR